MLAGCLLLAAGLSGCSQGSTGARPSDGPTGPSSAPAARTTPPTPSSQAAQPYPDRLAAFCAANRAKAKAVRGTVADDIAAAQAQAATARALLPIPDSSPQISSGAQTFIAAADENISILRRFPANRKVADLGLDPAFTQSRALKAVGTDKNYQAFLGWTMQACNIGGAG